MRTESAVTNDLIKVVLWDFPHAMSRLPAVETLEMLQMAVKSEDSGA